MDQPIGVRPERPSPTALHTTRSDMPRTFLERVRGAALGCRVDSPELLAFVTFGGQRDHVRSIPSFVDFQDVIGHRADSRINEVLGMLSTCM